jgi:hypothetical protein
MGVCSGQPRNRAFTECCSAGRNDQLADVCATAETLRERTIDEKVGDADFLFHLAAG